MLIFILNFSVFINLNSYLAKVGRGAPETFNAITLILILTCSINRTLLAELFTCKVVGHDGHFERELFKYYQPVIAALIHKA